MCLSNKLQSNSTDEKLTLDTPAFLYYTYLAMIKTFQATVIVA